MTSPHEEAFRRRVLFAVELLDAVTLTRVTEDVRVVAEGLEGRPIVNASGHFVWLDEDFAQLRKVTVDPKKLPYQFTERSAAEITRPLTTIELAPRAHYAFAGGMTGVRGALIEQRLQPPVPIGNAAVRLQWRDENNVWRDAPTLSRTDDKGSFAAIVRLTPQEIPLLNADLMRVRLRALRDGNERISVDFPLRQGRVADADPVTAEPFTFAWDELTPGP